MTGNPVYKQGQRVKFKFNGTVLQGKIEIVDANGTFEQNAEPSYDIFISEENLLCKHIRESDILTKRAT